MPEQPLTIEQARSFVRFALNDDIDLITVTKRGKTFTCWRLARTGRCLISAKKLEQSSVAEFAEYLNGVCRYKVFPDPNVYR